MSLYHTTIGIDNGSSGSIGLIQPGRTEFSRVPTQDYLHYGVKGTISKRLDREGLSHVIGPLPGVMRCDVRVYIERPFTGKFMNAVLPAHRFFEATIITLEDLGLGYEVVDSREWQAAVLGKVKGSAELKKASKLRGIQLYPQFADFINKHGDADGLLLTHFYHTK